VVINSKQRVHAALEGKPVDRDPVTVLYNMLYHLDHFAELTGLPQWQALKWRYAEPDEHLAIYRRMTAAAPFELLQPDEGISRAERQQVEFIALDGIPYLRFKSDGSLTPVLTESGHATDYAANQTRFVYTKSDIHTQVRVIPAERQLASGVNEARDAIVTALGWDHFIITGGVVGTLYSCGAYVGQLNALEMLKSEPVFIDALCQRILEQNIETIRTLAAAGGDAIYIDDATATSDMISVADYERFSLPYMKAMVEEIHRLGHKAIIIYFGGVMDRLDQIASIGADGLSVETSMKAYVNDIAEIAHRIGQQVTLFGNLDPISVLQDGTDAELEAEMDRQAEAGRSARGFIMCTGSPITPATPLQRVQRFIELGKRI
jgi:uroporphyrinogen-III decarboxylase